MSFSRTFFWMSASLVALVTISIISALSAANTVPASKVYNVSFAINANALKPTECAALNLANIIIIADGDNPTNKNDLILGTPGNNTINGNGGIDCILGGSGDDTLKGGNGQDILIGGPGNDALDGGGGTGDVCYGGGQAGDTFVRCETVIP